MRMKRMKKIAAFLLTLVMVCSLTACGSTPGAESGSSDSSDNSSSGSDNTLVVVTWGGELETALKKAADGFEKENNCTIQWESGPDYSKVKSMVDAGDVQWDVMTCDADFAYRGGSQGLLEKMDYNIISKDGIEDSCSDYGVPSYTWANVIAYNSSKYSADNAPQTWAEFWDTEKYPGERTFYKSPYETLEVALLADGVAKEDIYPIDVDRALKSLDKIKDKVSTWWESGAQPQQMLSSGQVDLAEAWAGRITSAKKEGATVDVVMNEAIVVTDQWVVPKGTKHKELAMKFLNFITSAEAGKTFSENITYGPANQKAYDLLDAAIVDTLPSAPKYQDQVVTYNAEYWAENYEEVNEKFQAWLLE